MNQKLFELAVLEIIISLGVTLLIIFSSYKLLKFLFFRKADVRGNNMAFTVFTSGVILSIGLILSEILPSITNIIRLASVDETQLEMASILGYGTLYLGIGFLMSVFVNLFTFVLFSMLTRGINEFREIQQNNLSVSILIVAILLSITLIVKESVALLISALVPYPEVTNYLQ